MTYRNDLPDESEPLRIFQSLPEVEWDSQDLTDMKRSVHEMIRAKSVEAALDVESTPSMPKRVSELRHWLRVATSARVVSSQPLRIAAAFGAVAVTTSLLISSFSLQPIQVAPMPLAASTPTSPELTSIEALPLVENLDSATELIQIEDSEMSLVVAAIQ
ncbi:MAG: hypothetical protein MPN21_10340 [Thermoanaerobaculia bacterium]|nr:hypothetical protein [Thermoanaerobaculia bacterium]